MIHPAEPASAQVDSLARHAVLAGVARPEEILESQAATRFREHYNFTSFRFAHYLAGHPLLQLPALLDLARRHPPSHTYWCNGAVQIEDNWDAGQRPKRYTLEQTVADIAANDSLVIFKHVQDDEVIGPLIRQCFAAIREAVGPRMREDVTASRGTILLASARRITSYHIDADVNFLFQVIGDKSIHVYNQTDRSLLTHEELERYHLGNMSGATFKPARDADGIRYRLKPGEGVHIPYTAPHWATTLDAHSVAVSINFDLRSTSRDAALYRLNGRLRRLGMAPTPPGISAWRDGVKLAAVQSLRIIRLVRHRGNAH